MKRTMLIWRKNLQNTIFRRYRYFTAQLRHRRFMFFECNQFARLFILKVLSDYSLGSMFFSIYFYKCPTYNCPSVVRGVARMLKGRENGRRRMVGVCGGEAEKIYISQDFT